MSGAFRFAILEWNSEIIARRVARSGVEAVRPAWPNYNAALDFRVSPSVSTAANSLHVLRSMTLSGLVVDEILRGIKTGELDVGAKLNETDLADRLGISRSPVREAFRALEEAGMVRLEKNRGVFIRDLSDEEAAELYEVRAGLDEMAGRLLAPRVTPGQLAELTALVTELENSTGSGGVTHYFFLNIAFHDRMVEMTGNSMLLGLYRQVVNRMHLLRRRGFSLAGSSAASHAEHRLILDALATRDAQTTACAMRGHVEAGFRRAVAAHHVDGQPAPSSPSATAPPALPSAPDGRQSRAAASGGTRPRRPSKAG
jgi:DNA-binding GntR family transcriptional regulator